MLRDRSDGYERDPSLKNHKVIVEIDQGLWIQKVIHPAKCDHAGYCSECGWDRTEGGEPCAHINVDECVLDAWIDNEGNEALVGSLVLTIEEEWNGPDEAPTLHVIAAEVER